MKQERDRLVAQNETLATEKSEVLANVSNSLSNTERELERVQTEKMLLDDKVSVLESEKEAIKRKLSTTEKNIKIL
jgi:predicted  nucleic acid-binding Zn-ribbon protein